MNRRNELEKLWTWLRFHVFDTDASWPKKMKNFEHGVRGWSLSLSQVGASQWEVAELKAKRAFRFPGRAR